MVLVGEVTSKLCSTHYSIDPSIFVETVCAIQVANEEKKLQRRIVDSIKERMERMKKLEALI
jgi:hypothetical protein